MDEHELAGAPTGQTSGSFTDSGQPASVLLPLNASRCTLGPRNGGEQQEEEKEKGWGEGGNRWLRIGT